MIIKITKENIERDVLLEDRHCSLWPVVKATIEDGPVPRACLRWIKLIDEKLEALGYKGSQVDVAAYAEQRFQLEDDGIAPHLP